MAATLSGNLLDRRPNPVPSTILTMRQHRFDPTDGFHLQRPFGLLAETLWPLLFSMDGFAGMELVNPRQSVNYLTVTETVTGLPKFPPALRRLNGNAYRLDHGRVGW